MSALTEHDQNRLLKSRLAALEARLMDVARALWSARIRGNAAEAKLAAIDAKHFTNDRRLFCLTCDDVWPCFHHRIIHDNPKEET